MQLTPAGVVGKKEEQDISVQFRTGQDRTGQAQSAAKYVLYISCLYYIGPTQISEWSAQTGSGFEFQSFLLNEGENSRQCSLGVLDTPEFYLRGSAA